MAKYTKEEQARRSRAIRARSKLHRVRAKALTAELDAVEIAAKAKTQPEINLHLAMNSKLRAEREIILDSLRSQIMALEQRIRDITVNYSEKFHVIRTRTSVLMAATNAEIRAAEAEIEKRYPDMQKPGAIWSAAAWKPIEDFLED